VKLALREVILAVRRAPLLSALGVITIAFSLFAFGLFGLVAVNIRDALRQVESRVEIRAFIADATPIEAIVTAVGDIEEFPEVAQAGYVSPDSALATARRELGEFADVFEAGVLPGSIEIRLKPDFRDPRSVKAVAARVGAYSFVDDVRYGEDWVAKLYQIRTIATIVGIVLGLAFAVVAVIIIGTTIRMSVLAREREIGIMRLVGATDMFVRLPFLIDGFVKGVLGGFLALALTGLARALIDHALGFHTVFFPSGIAALGVLGGALIGLAGSAISVGRQLRRV
jgi:cell division transport system permease protein